MIKITLDTNCIINLLDIKSESATSVKELSEILRYGLEGDANIAITTRVESDFSDDSDADRKREMVRRLSIFPVIGTVLRLDTSTFGSGDVLAGGEQEKLEKELIGVIFPGLKKEDSHYKNKINDIDHLIGHIINKRDIFTTDDQQILKKSETLKASFGLAVKNPQQTLEYLNLQGDKVVLVQEFYDKFCEYSVIVLKACVERLSDEEGKKYEDLRRWLIRKYPAIKDGLVNFKFQMGSVPVSGQRVFDQTVVVGLQRFSERLWKILCARDPIDIPAVLSSDLESYRYVSDSSKHEITAEFLNSIEDSLQGYLGKLESDF